MNERDIAGIVAAAKKRRKKGWRVFSTSVPLGGARGFGSSGERLNLIEDDLSTVIQTLEVEGWELEQVAPFALDEGNGRPHIGALVVFRSPD